MKKELIHAIKESIITLDQIEPALLKAYHKGRIDAFQRIAWEANFQMNLETNLVKEIKPSVT